MLMEAGGSGKRDGKGRLVLYGRVRDSRGEGVPGALVAVFSAGESEGIPLGHGFSGGDGWYAVSIPPPGEGGLCRYAVRATAGINPEKLPESGFSWRGEGGCTGRGAIQVECRVINHSLLTFTAGDGSGEIVLESVPETVNIDCVEEGPFNVKIIQITGRGYVRRGVEEGEGAFSLTVCRFIDAPGGDLLRFRITPDSEGGTAYDTGGLPAGLY